MARWMDARRTNRRAKQRLRRSQPGRILRELPFDDSWVQASSAAAPFFAWSLAGDFGDVFLIGGAEPIQRHVDLLAVLALEQDFAVFEFQKPGFDFLFAIGTDPSAQ